MKITPVLMWKRSKIAGVLGGAHGRHQDRGRAGGRTAGLRDPDARGSGIDDADAHQRAQGRAKFAPEGINTKGSALFIEVEDFAEVRQRLDGYPILMPERVTFYGMREIGVSEPGGHTVIFAAKA